MQSFINAKYYIIHSLELLKNLKSKNLIKLFKSIIKKLGLNVHPSIIYKM